MAPAVIDLKAIEPDSLYPPQLAASVLNKSQKTLANLRTSRRGPAWHRIGGSPFYRGRDLLAFIEGSRVSNDEAAKSRHSRRGV